ncbi:MAG: Stk1 family PASTA domain-containing Ser/Thr kinase, partial [Oscillospiraceae bacterium]
KLLNRNVAIKALKKDLENDKEFVRRFNIEAQAAASLSNPHIVSIYDVGCENGQYYIVMEYVEGKTLKEYIDEVGVVPWREAIGYAAQICDGLEEAHKNSVVHRDIKPQNIIMTNDGMLKVTDFGIARATSQSTMTMGKSTMGTAHYLSPEQARGGYTDQRTDIYSLGIVIYEMITGSLPFNDESAIAIAIKHLQEKPVPPTEKNPDIPKSLEKIVLKAISKEQGERYSSVTEMLNDLNKVLKNPNADINMAVIPVASVGDETIKMDAIDENTVREYEKGKQEKHENSMNANAIPSDYSKDIERANDINEQRIRRAKRKKERRVTAIAIVSAIVLIAGLGFAFMYMTGGLGLWSTKDAIEIPQVVGMDIKKAQEKFKPQFSIVETEKVESTKPAGSIVEQSPEANEKRKKEKEMIISVKVSSGKSSVTLENYTDWDVAVAKVKLEMLGVKVNVIEKYVEGKEPKKVLSQDPAGGTAVGSGDLVTLYVSRANVTASEGTTT